MSEYLSPDSDLSDALRTARWVFAILVLASLALPLYYYPQLPERTASHFNLSGKADAWDSRTVFVATQMGITGFLALVTLGILWLIRHTPAQWINIPHKEYWLAPERKEGTYRRIEFFLLWIMNLTYLLLLTMFYLIILFNLKRLVLSTGYFLFPLVLYFLGMGIILYRMMRTFRVPQGE